MPLEFNLMARRERRMTLQPYDTDRLDQLALKVLDVSCSLRAMAARLREEQPSGFALHDRKALYWIERLEHWARKSEVELEMASIRQRGARKAMRVADATQPDAE